MTKENDKNAGCFSKVMNSESKPNKPQTFMTIKNPFAWLFAFGFLIVFAIGFIIRIKAFNGIIINDWILRDLERAFHLFNGNYFPLAGPELTSGGRLPGPFLYILMALPLIINAKIQLFLH